MVNGLSLPQAGLRPATNGGTFDTWQRRHGLLIREVDSAFDADAVCPIAPSDWQLPSGAPENAPDPNPGFTNFRHVSLLPESTSQAAAPSRPKSRDVPLSQQLWKQQQQQQKHLRLAGDVAPFTGYHVAPALPKSASKWKIPEDANAAGFCGSPLTPLAATPAFGSGRWSDTSSNPSSPRHVARQWPATQLSAQAQAPAAAEDEEGEDWEEHVPCLNFEEAEVASKALGGQGKVVEGVTIVLLASRFASEGVAAGVIYALHVAEDEGAIVPGDDSVQLLLPAGFRPSVNGKDGKKLDTKKTEFPLYQSQKY